MSQGFFDIMGLMRRWYAAVVPPVVSERFDLVGTTATRGELVGAAFTASGFYADEIDDRLVASPGPTALDLFSTQSFDDNNSVYNVDGWMADFDFTGVPAHSLTSGDVDDESPVWRTGALLSPRHGAVALHSWDHPSVQPNGNGRKVIWIAQDGTRHERTVIGLSGAVGADLLIAYYDADLPSTIANYRVLPLNYENYSRDFPPHNTAPTGAITPMIRIDQEWQALVQDWSVSNIGIFGWIAPTDANRLAYYEPAIPGDSSHPNFVALNGELVLLGVSQGTTSGTFATVFLDAINTAMLDLEAAHGGSDGYQLTEWSPPATPSTQGKLVGTRAERITLVGV